MNLRVSRRGIDTIPWRWRCRLYLTMQPKIQRFWERGKHAWARKLTVPRSFFLKPNFLNSASPRSLFGPTSFRGSEPDVVISKSVKRVSTKEQGLWSPCFCSVDDDAGSTVGVDGRRCAKSASDVASRATREAKKTRRVSRIWNQISVNEGSRADVSTLSCPLPAPASKKRSQVCPKKSVAFAFRENSGSQSLVVISRALVSELVSEKKCRIMCNFT